MPKAQNKVINKIPPIILKKRAREPNIVVIPRYIGFLEYLKIFSVTSFVAFSGFKGLTVVLLLLNDVTADVNIKNSKNIKVLARVGEKTLTEENVVLFGANKGVSGDERELSIENWISQSLLLSEAKKEGLSPYQVSEAQVAVVGRGTIAEQNLVNRQAKNSIIPLVTSVLNDNETEYQDGAGNTFTAQEAYNNPEKMSIVLNRAKNTLLNYFQKDSLYLGKTVEAFDKFWANINVIGPRGDIQLAATPVEDLILLLSFKVSS